VGIGAKPQAVAACGLAVLEIGPKEGAAQKEMVFGSDASEFPGLDAQNGTSSS